MKNYFKNYEKKFELIILVFLLLTPAIFIFKWFSGGAIIYFWDQTFPLDPSLNLHQFSYLWKSSVFPGFSDPAWSWLPYIFIVYILQKLLISISLAQSVLYWSLLAGSSLSFYMLARFLSRSFTSKIGKAHMLFIALGSILYSYNLYIYYYSFRIFNPQQFIIAFLPLHFLALLKLYPLQKTYLSFKEKIFWTCIFFGSLFLMSSGFSTIIFFAEYLLFVALYLGFYAVIKRRFSPLDFLELILFLLLIGLFNLWFVLPMVLSLQSSYDAAATIGTDVYFFANSTYSYLLNVLRLIGLPPMISPRFLWEGLYINNILFTLPLFIFPTLIFLLGSRLRKIKERETMLFIFAVFLVSLFVAKQANPPFNFIMKFAFDYIPFFGVFRDAYHKAGIFYIFSYSLLTTTSLVYLFRSFDRKRKSFFIGIFAIVATATLIVSAPFFLFDSLPHITAQDALGEKTVYSAKTKIPNEYMQVKNALEESCEGSIVMVIPRTAILSSAVWQEGYSYIGQDIFRYLVGCNVISSQLSQNKNDSYTTAPYLFLEGNDIDGFKNFLRQNSIGIVLTRKDYVKNSFTDFSHVDSLETEKILEEDPDFTTHYKDSIFTLFVFDDVQKNYGFSMHPTATYINSELKTANDFKLMSIIHGTESAAILYKNTDYESYTDYIKRVVILGNCVGCVIVDVPSESNVLEENILSRFKEFVKLTFQRNVGEPGSEEVISSSIITMHKEFENLLFFLSENNKEKILESSKTYKKLLQNSIRLIEDYRSDFFSINSKYIEMHNFLRSENGKLAEYLRVQSLINDPHDPLNDDQLETYLIDVFTTQDLILKKINKVLWRTDFDKKNYNIRLDTPETGQYECRVVSNNSGIFVKSVTIDSGKNIPAELLNIVDLSQGSHKIVVNYSVDEPFAQTTNQIETRNSISLGELKSGVYALEFEIDTTQKEPFAVIVSDGPLESLDLQSIKTPNNNKYIYRQIIKETTGFKRFYSEKFIVNSEPDKRNYFLHFAPFYPESFSNPVAIRNLKVQRHVEDRDIDMYCVIHERLSETKGYNSAPGIKKISPVKYELLIPDEFGSGFLHFNQSFNADWRAYYNNNVREELHHIESAHGNAWFLDGSKGKVIEIEFTKQKVVEKYLKLSVIGFIMVGGVFLYLLKRNYEN